MKFKIKSNWYENEQIFKIKPKGYYIYIKLRMLEQSGYKNTLAISINYLYNLISPNLNITKNDTKKCLTNIKRAGIIFYDRIPNTYTELFEVKLLDLPMTERKENKDVPITKDDNYLIVDSEIIEYLVEKNLTLEDVVIFMCIKKYSNSEFINLGCLTIYEYTGVNKNKVSEILSKLKKLKLIGYSFAISKRGRKCNSISLNCNTLEEIKKTLEVEKEIKI